MLANVEITIKSDYDGYFERLVRGWIERKIQNGGELKNKIITISAGPWRPSVVSYKINDEKKSIYLDFYSAFRAGFGSLSEEEINAIIKIL